jgi:hypothetical protein
MKTHYQSWKKERLDEIKTVERGQTREDPDERDDKKGGE